MAGDILSPALNSADDYALWHDATAHKLSQAFYTPADLERLRADLGPGGKWPPARIPERCRSPCVSRRRAETSTSPATCVTAGGPSAHAQELNGVASSARPLSSS
jgi:hypothetical protein